MAGGDVAIRNPERCGRLYGESGIVLEIHAGSEFPGKLVGAIDFKHVGRIKIQVVVVAVDVVVRVVEIVAGGLVRKAAAEGALLALNSESCKKLPLIGQALDAGELDGVVGVVVELREVR